MNKFSQSELLKKIDSYVAIKYLTQVGGKDKLFYEVKEFSGWRFWLKALRHLDFGSMRSQIKYNWFE